MSSLAMKSKKVSASEIGRLGGIVRSEAKTQAARENGKLGGRPKKPIDTKPKRR